MSYTYNDGGKSSTSLKSNTDCGIRAMAIACSIPYMEARQHLKTASKNGKMGSGAISDGIYKEDIGQALKEFGFMWQSAPKLSGRKARYSDLPQGRIVVRMAKHFAAVLDGELHDSWDSSEKMVYGYWIKQ